MKVNIRYFGRLIEIAGKNDEVIETKSGSLSTLLKLIMDSVPELEKEVYAIFVNNKKAENTNLSLKENDEICLMPPFAGG